MSPRSPIRGDELPSIVTPPPGPRSRAAVTRLRRTEGAAIWGADPSPIVWSRARGAVVEDLDGNRYIDLTSGFGVAFLGHAAPEVKRAVARQAGRLVQGLGDLHPHATRERLVRRLSKLGGGLSRVLLTGTGSEAVELALQTAALATGRRAVVAFEGGYHGLLGRAREVTHHPTQSARLRPGDAAGTVFIPYPDRARCPVRRPCASCDLACLEHGFERVDRALSSAAPPGAILVEPIQGRAGVVIPPRAFLPRLRALARGRGLLVVYDEILTGAGRTGRFWAWEQVGPEAEPDLLTAGKALGGGMALGAVLGRPEILDVWARHVSPSGESPHASTYYAHPMACAGSLAALDRIEAYLEQGVVAEKGALFRSDLAEATVTLGDTVEIREAGLLIGIRLGRTDQAVDPAPGGAASRRLLERGILAIPSGRDGDALTLLPPVVITEGQIKQACETFRRCL